MRRLPNDLFSSFRWINLSVLAPVLMLALFATACSYTTPPEEVPAPTDQTINKDFFRKQENRNFLRNKETGFEISVAEAEFKPEFKALFHPQTGGSVSLSAKGRTSGVWEVVQKSVNVPRTFLCGWAPVSEVGFISEWTQVHGAPLLPACNIQFDIEETKLVGRQVVPGVPRDDWPTLITIPVNSHFDYVQREDKYGRPQREWIRRTDRHTWNARGSMSLNWRGLTVHDWSYELLYGGTLTVSVKDVVRTTHKGKSYIAFTSSVSSGYFGTHHQAQFRVNFLEFDSDPTFEKRLYHQDNSNHFGTLWGLGTRVNGIHPVKYIGRWDFREQAIPHEICLNGFDGAPEAKKIALETLEIWNQTLRDAEIIKPHQTAFVASNRKMDYLFDLRCSSISYVSDKRISARSPLGIAMAQMDVRTGKILWSGSMNYGGALEEYVEHYANSDFGTGDTFMDMPSEAAWSDDFNRPIIGGNPLAHLTGPTGITSNFLNPNDSAMLDVSDTAYSIYRGRMMGLHNGLEDFAKELQKENLNLDELSAMAAEGKLEALAKKVYAGPDGHNPSKHDWKVLGQFLAGLLADVKGESNILTFNQFARSSTLLSTYGSAVKSIVSVIDEISDDTRSFLNGNNWQAALMGSQTHMTEQMLNIATMGRDYHQLSPEMQRAHKENRAFLNIARMHATGVQDLDHTIGRFAMQVAAAPAEIANGIDVEDLVLTSLKKTMLHEFGHMLGLGHNFRDNIMPKKGSVPHRYHDDLIKARDKHPVVNLNFSTIMGYPHAYQVMARRPEDVKVGKQDELVLRYIYNNQIPVYNGDPDVDADFEYLTLGKDIPIGRDGRIPSKDVDLERYNAAYKGYKVTYFPSCTDLMAMLALDPYCNRWDLGYDATTIVNGYLDDYQNNWLTKLNNFAKVRNNLWLVRYYLWKRSLYTFSRIRIFYDHMRREYRDEILEIANHNPKNLFDFSKCANEDQNNAKVKAVIQSADPELEELCNVNRDIILALNEFITDPGEDFSTFDDNDWSVPTNEWGNGFADWSRVWGTWKELGMLPVKLSALFTLTTARSFFTWGHHIVDNFKYAKQGVNNKYIYASLYPREFTKTITDSVLNNIKLNSIDGKEPRMDRIALFMGGFLSQSFGMPFASTNDFHEFDGTYMENLKAQSQFIFNMRYPFVPVFVRIKRPTGTGKDPEKISNFTAFIYEWGTEVKELGNAYMLPEGKVFFGTTPETFVYPISDLIFLSDEIALVWGIRVEYTTSDYSTLWVEGVKDNLFKRYETIGKNCVENAGLDKWFSSSNEEFGGFYIPMGIAGNPTRYGEFTDSVEAEFNKYLSQEKYSTHGTVCTKALDDVGLVVTQALALNNIFMPLVFKYMVH